MIGRADIEGSKSNVAMNAWLPQTSYPCGNFSDTSCFKLSTSKRIDRSRFHGPYSSSTGSSFPASFLTLIIFGRCLSAGISTPDGTKENACFLLCIWSAAWKTCNSDAMSRSPETISVGSELLARNLFAVRILLPFESLFDQNKSSSNSSRPVGWRTCLDRIRWNVTQSANPEAFCSVFRKSSFRVTQYHCICCVCSFNLNRSTGSQFHTLFQISD